MIRIRENKRKPRYDHAYVYEAGAHHAIACSKKPDGKFITNVRSYSGEVPKNNFL